MITKCKCIGLSRGISKEKKPFSTLFIDVTPCVEDGDKNIGVFVSSIWRSGHYKDDVVGSDFICSVDKFGRITDIEI